MCTFYANLHVLIVIFKVRLWFWFLSSTLHELGIIEINEYIFIYYG